MDGGSAEGLQEQSWPPVTQAIDSERRNLLPHCALAGGALCLFGVLSSTVPGPAWLVSAERFSHCDEGRVLISIVRMFANLCETQGGEGRMVLG